MFKKLFYLILIAAMGVVLWFAFGIWIRLYSVYSFPPSKENPKGVTLIVRREELEPKFNSPDYKAPKRDEKKEGMGWSSSSGRSKIPLNFRTVVKLPYVEWAYKRSLQPQEID